MLKNENYNPHKYTYLAWYIKKKKKDEIIKKIAKVSKK